VRFSSGTGSICPAARRLSQKLFRAFNLTAQLTGSGSHHDTSAFSALPQVRYPKLGPRGRGSRLSPSLKARLRCSRVALDSFRYLLFPREGGFRSAQNLGFRVALAFFNDLSPKSRLPCSYPGLDISRCLQRLSTSSLPKEANTMPRSRTLTPFSFTPRPFGTRTFRLIRFCCVARGRNHRVAFSVFRRLLSQGRRLSSFAAAMHCRICAGRWENACRSRISVGGTSILSRFRSIVSDISPEGATLRFP